MLGLLATSTVVLGLVALVATTAVQSYVSSRLDAQVKQAQGALIGVLVTVPVTGVASRSLPNGAIGLVLSSDGRNLLTFGTGPDGDELVAPSTATTRLLLPDSGGRTYDADLATLGRYRCESSSAILNGAPVTVVTALPVAPTQLIVHRLVLVEVLGVIGALLVLAGAGTAVVRVGLRPLQRISATARRVAALPLDQPGQAITERVADADPATEVGQVGAAFNAMLGTVDAALMSRAEGEERLRRFVADASHELRTPLASIRGYAELARGSGRGDAVAVDHALGRIESEAQRMGGLVDGLLLLARLDAEAAGNRQAQPLLLAEVDIALLAADAVADAQAASPDRPWDLFVPPEPLEVRGDEQRLRQVLANLLANARAHTPAGTRVGVSASREGGPGPDGWVVLEVADAGPGIPADVLPHVFERFVRADRARARASGGSGLGLAIVQGVVQAHGGSVEALSGPGRTVFRVRLPADPLGVAQPEPVEDTVAGGLEAPAQP